MKRILVIGGHGFVGKELYQRLAKKHETWTLSRRKCDGSRHISANINMKGDWIRRIRNMEFDIVVNSSKTCLESHSKEAEIKPIINIISCLGRMTRLIHLSSGAVYGESAGPGQHLVEEWSCKPLTLYGKCKLKEEMILKEWQAIEDRLCIVRLSNVIGKGSSSTSLIGKLEHLANEPEDSERCHFLHKWSFNYVRDLVDVRDVASAIELLMFKVCDGVYNVSSGVETNQRDMVTKFLQIIGKENLLGRGTSRPELIHQVLDNSKLMGEGWGSAHNLESTLKWVAGVEG